jgi:hypothetical protein
LIIHVQPVVIQANLYYF